VGAKVLLDGDPEQLIAVDAGGAFGMLVRDRNNADGDGAPELAGIWRYKNTWEKTLEGKNATARMPPAANTRAATEKTTV
jgi:hypothetical protein